MAIFFATFFKKEGGAANCTKDLFGRKRAKVYHILRKKMFNSSYLDHRFLYVARIYIVGFEIFKKSPSNN